MALIGEILAQNSLQAEDVEAVFFTATSDLNACYPARAIRERFAMSNTAFMCFAEMTVVNSLDHCLRACVFTSKIQQSDCIHCYLGRAKSLREDL